MKDLKLDSNGDLLFDGRNFFLTRTTDESLAQRLKIKLSLFLGEYAFDTSVGVPWYQEVVGKKVSKSKIDAIIRKQVESTTGVKEILEFTSEVDASQRTYTITKLTIRDIDGGKVEVNI